MIILKEKKTQIKEGWVPSSKAELLSALRKYSSRRVDIFSSKKYYVEEARMMKPVNGMYLFIDKYGFTVGFPESAISGSVSKLNATCFLLFLGGQVEIKIAIHDLGD